jgi:hypothetical protein
VKLHREIAQTKRFVQMRSMMTMYVMLMHTQSFGKYKVDALFGCLKCERTKNMNTNILCKYMIWHIMCPYAFTTMGNHVKIDTKWVKGWIYTQQGRLLTKGWSNRSWIHILEEKILSNKWNIGRASQTMKQTFKHRPKHEMMQTWWTLDIPLERTLKKLG